jgi:hypothetical protein
MRACAQVFGFLGLYLGCLAITGSAACLDIRIARESLAMLPRGVAGTRHEAAAGELPRHEPGVAAVRTGSLVLPGLPWKTHDVILCLRAARTKMPAPIHPMSHQRGKWA